MDRLADETLQLVFNELDDPGPFSVLSRRYRSFSQDPYIRARYLLSRASSTQVLFVALGRPSITTERVLDILLSSGAHLSRYLVQLAVHHYFRAPVPFIKHPWVKALPLPVFSHFLHRATARLGDFATARGEDDGTLFCLFVKESRLAPATRTVPLEVIEEMLAQYKFMPFCDKDPIMAQFPLALAVEPRLLPLAVANGFRMDSSYRDYVFRRMFERSAAPDAHARKILHNVRELSRLDPSMFVSRTVAAEVCMEAQANAPAYSALKTLDRARELKFELSALVHDLLLNFATTRSISAESSAGAIQFLYRDLYPCADTAPSSLRAVMLLSVFASTVGATAAHSKLVPLGLAPLDRADVAELLRSPFIETFNVVAGYAGVFMGLSAPEIRELLAEVALDCLPVSSKGGMLRAIVKKYPEVAASIASAVHNTHALTYASLPPSSDERACADFSASLCGDLYSVRKGSSRAVTKPAIEGTAKEGGAAGEAAKELRVEVAAIMDEEQFSTLGRIGQLTLSAAIHNDDLTTARRRRYASAYALAQYPDFTSLLPYPAEALHIGRWLANHFGARHAVTAELMKHVVINQPAAICTLYVSQLKVPLTLAHFKLLAHLGRAPAFVMFTAIEDGARFYESEADYLTEEAPTPASSETEDGSTPKPSCKADAEGAPNIPACKPEQSARGAEAQASSSPRRLEATTCRKRPRRSAAAVKSYALPCSDEDEDDTDTMDSDAMPRARRPVESEMSKWIRHLAALHRDELRRLNERKKRTESRASKNDFVRFVGPRLREWRRRENERARSLADGSACGTESINEEYDGDDGEYRAARKPKRRRA